MMKFIFKKIILETVDTYITFSFIIFAKTFININTNSNFWINTKNIIINILFMYKIKIIFNSYISFILLFFFCIKFKNKYIIYIRIFKISNAW